MIRLAFLMILVVLAATPCSLAQDRKVEPGKTDPVEAGLNAFKKGDFDAAVGHFTEAINQNPKHVFAHSCRGAAYYHQKKYDLAVDDAFLAAFMDAKAAEESCKDAKDPFQFMQRGFARTVGGRKVEGRDDLHAAMTGNTELGKSIAAFINKARAEDAKNNGVRALDARVNTVGLDRRLDGPALKKWNDNTATKVHATADGKLVIDVKVAQNQLTNTPQLMVRLFDKNGQYLTHFTTKELFTHDEGLAVRLARVGEAMYVLDAEKGNRLVYPVNARDLRDAAIIEVGWWMPLDGR